MQWDLNIIILHICILYLGVFIKNFCIQAIGGRNPTKNNIKKTLRLEFGLPISFYVHVNLHFNEVMETWFGVASNILIALYIGNSYLLKSIITLTFAFRCDCAWRCILLILSNFFLWQQFVETRNHRCWKWQTSYGYRWILQNFPIYHCYKKFWIDDNAKICWTTSARVCTQLKQLPMVHMGMSFVEWRKTCSLLWTRQGVW